MNLYNSSSQTATLDNRLVAQKAFRNLYFLRTAFSVVWVILVALLADNSQLIASILLIVYPAWDAYAIFLDSRIRTTSESKNYQYLNMSISVVTCIAVVFALQKGVPEALIIFGAWAILTGLLQLLPALKRRTELSGQWPMILSGGQSILAGISFIYLAHEPSRGIASLTGYAAFGAFYFLLSAIRLSKTVKDNRS